MPKRTPSGKKTAVADVESKLKREYGNNPSAVMWAAGFYEGEGCVGPRSAIIAQVNIWPLQRLVEIFGGKIRDGARLDKRRLTTSQPIWEWHICGEAGRDFIAAIYPFLSPRRQSQIDVKFITHEKFAIRRAKYSKEQSDRVKATLARVIRDPLTGRLCRAS